MSMPILSTLSLATALGLAALACQSASASYDGTNWKIDVKGDDAKLVAAKGWEEALKQAEQNLVDAQNATPPNPAFVQDWKDIVNNTIEAKKSADSAEVEPGFHWEYEGDDKDGN